MNSTATQVSDIFGEKLYQQRARKALPILVRQANACQDITYGQLADELQMPNARNLNFVLGSIGVTLDSLSKQWGEQIPRIQCLVKNKDTGMPGDGVFEFMFSRNEISSLEPAQKKIAIEAILARIFIYQKWNAVLDALDLESPKPEFFSSIEAARNYSGGGESEHHKQLKDLVANNPQLLEIPSTLGKGQIEFRLPSGDSVDVVFQRQARWIPVEVKSKISGPDDIARGLFQCIKYQSVIKAWQGSVSNPSYVNAVLALGGPLPDSLKSLATTLGIRVVDSLAND